MRNPDTKLNVLVLAASLRRESLNRRLAELSARIAERSGANVDRASMRDFDVPLYDGDLQESSGIPQGAQRCLEQAAGRQSWGELVASGATGG